MAANRKEITLDSGTTDDDYTPSTPEERGDFLESDESTKDEPEDLEKTDELEIAEPNEELDTVEELDTDEEPDEELDEEALEQSDEELEALPPSEDEELETGKKTTKKPNSQRVPLDRLNKEIDKRRVLETEIKRMRGELETSKNHEGEEGKKEDAPEETQAFTRDEFESMQEAMLDGETDKAFSIFGKMMSSQTSMVRTNAENEVSTRVRNELDQDRAMNELQETASSLSEQYPELDSSGDDADNGLIEEVVEMRDIYVDRGLSPAAALKKSVHLVALDNSLVDRTAKPKADIAKPTKKINTKGKLEAAKKERGKLSGTGGNNTRPDVNIARLSDDEFANLSAEAKAQARGDYVT